MNFQIRKQIILSEVEEKGSIDVKELADQLQTSEITIRRDLAVLAQKGLLVRTHGGAVKLSVAKDPITFNNKSAVNAEQKENIGRLAAAQIQEGDSVFIDCGSTTFHMCPFIKHLNIKVVTNSLPIMYTLVDSSIKLNIAGGEIDAERQAVHGLMAIEHLKRYKVDKAFIGVDGLSLTNGLSAASEKEASISTAMAENAHHVFLLCDSSKLEKERYFQFAPLTIIHTLITDNQAPIQLLEKYTKAGIQVLTA